jgi:hypothetical protein
MNGPRGLLRNCRSGISFAKPVGEIPAICALMEQYKDAPMDFADACVVRMADLNPGATVCTTDGHFRFSRKSSGEIITVLAPIAG